ncbi:MAG: Conserved hypothetical protein potentially related to ribose or hydroxymethylpyrimidine metabolism, partial [uncultured Friedmanniella sp.]
GRRARRLPRAGRAGGRLGRDRHPHGLPGARRRGDRPAGLPRRLRHPARRGRPTGHPALAGPDVRPGAGRLLGQRGRGRCHPDIPRPHRGAPGDGRRGQGLPARRRARDRPARPAGHAHSAGPALHRRRLQLPRADPRRRHPPLRRPARHLRRHRAARLHRPAGLRRRRRRARPRPAGLHPGAGPAHLQRAHPALQDRRRLPGLAERAAARLRHGRRPAGGPLAPPPRADLPAGRRRGAAPRPRAGRRPDAGPAGRARAGGL